MTAPWPTACDAIKPNTKKGINNVQSKSTDNMGFNTDQISW